MMEPVAGGDLKVSIIINNYNYGQFLAAAIDSALAQSYAHCEVVVVDDGSTDGSHEIIAGFGDRIRPVLKANGGQASAFNAGFAVSRGDIICMLDSDDFFHPNKVEQVVRAFAAHPGVGWVFHPVCRTFSDGQTMNLPDVPRTLYLDHQESALRGKLPGPPGPVTSGLAMSRELLDNILPMSESIRITADNYLIFLAEALAPGAYLHEVLAVQRMHGANHYTMREDKIVQARVHLLIATNMRRGFPRLSVLSNRVFAKALALYTTALRRDSICEATIKEYLKRTALLELPDLLLRAGYHAIRGKFANPIRLPATWAIWRPGERWRG
jgi:glycosyltransferase involved in cell wall biosynthesis